MTASPATAPNFRGSAYRLVAIAHGDNIVSVPPSINAGVGFAPHGRLYINDTVNRGYTQYETIPGGFSTVQGFVSTAAAYGGHDPVRTEIILALRDIPHGNTVVSGTTNDLILSVGGYTITLNRTGPASDPTWPLAGSLLLTQATTGRQSPIAGQVTLHGPHTYTIDVPATGQFKLSVLPGTYTVTVQNPWAHPARRQLATGQDHRRRQSSNPNSHRDPGQQRTNAPPTHVAHM